MLMVALAVCILKGYEDRFLVSHQFSGFTYKNGMGVTQACGALIHVDIADGSALCQGIPWWYFVNPSSSWRFTKIEPLEIVLQHGYLCTEFDARQVPQAVGKPCFVIGHRVEIGRRSSSPAAQLDDDDADLAGTEVV